MRCVQQAQLHRLEGMNVIRQGSANFVPIRPSCAEFIFNHPLAKVLMSDRHIVFDAKVARQRQFSWARCRDDAINHRIRESNVQINPPGEGRVGHPGKPQNSLAQNLTVTFQVIAALAGKRTGVAHAAQLQRRNYRTKGGLWRSEVTWWRNVARNFRCMEPILESRVVLLDYSYQEISTRKVNE